MKSVIYWLVFLGVFSSCQTKNVKRERNAVCVGNIELDSFRNATVTWRSQEALLYTHNFYSDTIEWRHILVRENDSDEIIIKYSGSWVTLQEAKEVYKEEFRSIGLSPDRLRYCFNVMRSEDLLEVRDGKGRFHLIYRYPRNWDL